MALREQNGAAVERFESSAMHRLAEHFQQLATGAVQVPRQRPSSNLLASTGDPERLHYHDLMVQQSGPLFSHFLASVPYILEEMCRVGVALTRLARLEAGEGRSGASFYEVDAFDGTNGRSLARFSDGLIRTFTNSPNQANESHFHRTADPAQSLFLPASFLDVTPHLFQREPFSRFADGFDFLYETAAFQFYSKDRLSQVGHVRRLLKADGLAFFLEKLNQPDAEEYERRERVKDERFKTRYFTAEEIAWKKQQMLEQMRNGQVERADLEAALSRHFGHVRLLWSSTNFHEFVASDDARRLDRFVSLLAAPAIPEEFACDSVDRACGASAWS